MAPPGARLPDRWKKGCTGVSLGTTTARTCKTNQREYSVDSGPNSPERDEASQKQQREQNARGAKEQRRQEAEEREEREQIRQEEQEDASGSARKHGVRRRVPHERDGPEV
jgi:hypothetical protein